MRIKTRRAAIAAGAAGALVAPLAMVAHAAVVVPETPRGGSLVQVGPINGTGYPQWYRDSTGLRLEACTTPDDPMCMPLADEIPDPNSPVSYPDNWPGEIFYYMSESSVTAGAAGTVDVVMNLEGAWAAEEVIEGDQIVFGRIRIRADDAADGKYRITHPYGQDLFTASGGEGINMTEDIGIAPGAFGGALQSRLGPFLTWDTFPNDPTLPDQPGKTTDAYIGDPGVEHTVKGSPYDTNFVRVEQQLTDGTWQTIGYNDMFAIQGRLAVNDGVDVEQATYRKVGDDTVVEVFASSEAGESIKMIAPDLGYKSITLEEDSYTVQTTATSSHDEGRYYGRFAVKPGVAVTGGADATKIVIQNAGDVPVANKTVSLTDVVTVTKAAYDGSTLVVEANSSDAAAELKVAGYGPLTAGTATFENVDAPPHVITVTSNEGGTATVPLNTSGPYTAPDLPVAVATATPTRPIAGQAVTLDASQSLDANSYEWSLYEVPVGSEVIGFDDKGADVDEWTIAKPTFTPDRPGSYTFDLVAVGDSGRSPVQRIVVDVVSPAAQVTARTGGHQTDVLRGSTIKLDGSDSIGAATYHWQQIPVQDGQTIPDGLRITLDDESAVKPTFKFPLMPLPAAPGPNSTYLALNPGMPIKIRLTVTGVDGVTTSTQDMIVRAAPETLTVDEARYRTRGEWRISGTSSLRAGQQVAVVLDGRMNPSGDPILASARGRVIGYATVDTLGAWSYVGPGPNPQPQLGLASQFVTAVSAQGDQALGTITVTS